MLALEMQQMSAGLFGEFALVPPDDCTGLSINKETEYLYVNRLNGSDTPLLGGRSYRCITECNQGKVALGTGFAFLGSVW